MTKVKGRIDKIFEATSSTSGFRKRGFALEAKEHPLYPQYLSFELTNERGRLLDKFKEGDFVEVSFEIQGRKWDDPESGNVKYFNSLQAWKIDHVDEF